MEPEESLSGASEVARGTFWGLLGSGAFKIFSFVYTIYIARVVSQNDIGLFYLALGLTGLFCAWKTFGLPAAIVRYVPFYESRGEHGKVRSLLKWAYAINLVSGALVAAAVWALSDYAGAIYQNPGLPEALRLLSAFMLLENVFSMNIYFLQGRSDIRSMQLASNVQNASKLVITILLFWLFGPNLATLTAGFVLSYLLAAALSSKMACDSARTLGHGSGALQLQELLHEIIPFGIMLSVIQVLWTLVSYADRALLGYLLPPAQANGTVAIYSIAVAFAVNVMVFPGTVGGIFLPTISRLVGKGDMEGVRRTMATSQRWMLFISVPFTLVMIAFSSEMLSIFFGGSYAPGSAAMAIFCAGLLFSVLSYTVTLALAGMRRVDLEFKVALCVMAANIALCILLIPPYGMDGAAVAAAAGFVLSALMFFHYGSKVIGFNSPGGIYRMLAAAIATCALLFLLKPAVASAAASLPALGGAALQPYVSKAEYLLLLGLISLLSMAVFSALSLLLKCFAHEDVAIMKKAARLARVPPGVESFAERIALMGVEPEKKTS